MGVLKAKVGGVWQEIPGVGAGAVDVPWIVPTMLNGWANYDASLFSPAGYRKIGDIVYLRGLVKSGTMAVAVFTLPVGYRPPRALILAATSNDLFGEIRVEMDGTVKAQVGSNIWISLDNIQFSVTP